MQENIVLGYCPKLYEALQMAVHELMPHELVDMWPPSPNQCNEEDRLQLMEMILEGLIADGDDDFSDIVDYIVRAYEAIDDVALAQMIEEQSLVRLRVHPSGYYMATKEFIENETDFH